MLLFNLYNHFRLLFIIRSQTMNLEVYKNFIIVAETGNITVAATQLNIVQPALSKQLSSLEKHYGVKLIEKHRGRRQIVLTEAGVDFLRRAREICKAEEGITLDMQAYKTTISGTLRVSVSHAAMTNFMDKYLLPFAKLHPDINYQLHEEAVAEQIPSLKNDLIDIAYANAPLQESASFNCISLKHEPFYAVFYKSNNFSFANQNKILLSNLQGYPICCNYGCYSLLSNLCTANGFMPEIRLIATSGTAAAKFAENGNVIAVVSLASCEEIASSLQKILIDEPKLAYHQTLFWSKNKQLPPVVKEFVTFVTRTQDKNKS